MINAYIYYPNAKISMHCDPDCHEIHKNIKANQINIEVNTNTISQVLSDFMNGEYHFYSKHENNDMWLIVDFGNRNFDRAVIFYIHSLLSQQSEKFREIQPVLHCDYP